ncbi:DUF2599 domain-containing protein [Nocardia sp. CDC159]|uniref:DUF2599 domain-containing protein n=1 Tax=Nocardia pulmonis TaxID=2951408 RepID=A0A9X2E6D9_9NOCA|nr:MULTISPECIES: DUF2599 domain-containing protein [Nocardia]MCM6772363.1 DUF2599 domain-containing protein [Nocardia pulmonis]MCM6784979.1 DUF2599 domain-containing protein [Nocardia sp. CDC159]
MRLGMLRIGALALSALIPALGACGAPDRSEPVAQRATTTAHPTTTTVVATTPAIPTTDPFADSALIDHTDWTADADGRRLRVYPTAAGRADTFPAALNRAWAEVLTAAPDADTPGMYDQFRCHWEWARLVKPNKPSWNLEPWRTAVGYDATVQAMCNPGGPDPAGN